MARADSQFEPNPLWYKDAVIYEVHIRSFYDSNDDGVGDIRGLIEKLDYLQALGVTAIWLLPFYPSPLKDDGYDIADYFSIHPDYGTLADFRHLLREAHRRGLRVITELVINHTSDQHMWFKRAQRSRPGSKWRDFYVWSESPLKYRDARVIFKDFEHSNWTWDPQTGQYYWHRFYSHQPDLNYDNPHLREEIFRVVDFWFDMGVDGLRLDAVPYLYQREGTNCENLPEVHVFLRELRSHIDGKFSDKMLLAEANQWPEDAAAYFGQGDECHMAFNFPVMPRLFMAIRMEDRFPVIDMIEQSSGLPDSCQWAIFLRNHDELTLEMVTDEERDYMYRAYAADPKARINVGIRRRLAPLLENDRRQVELLNVLLLSLPGTPVLYYGDEIGMGDNYYLGDRHGVRTPMQWSPDRNAGFSRTNPQKLFLPVVSDPEYHYTAVNVETQERNQSSLMWWMRQVISLRKRHKAFGHGAIRFVRSNNTKVLTFVRSLGSEHILVAANLSGWCQCATLELSDYKGFVPEEMFGGSLFPEVTGSSYSLALGPYNTYWFTMKKVEQPAAAAVEHVAHLELGKGWEELFAGESGEFEEILRVYLPGCRWFGGKGRIIRRVEVASVVRVEAGGELFYLVRLNVHYTSAAAESYLLPIGLAQVHDSLMEAVKGSPRGLIAQATLGNTTGIIYDAMFSKAFRDALLELIAGRHVRRAEGQGLVGVRGRKLRSMMGGRWPPLESRVLNVEQSNTSVIYEDKLFLKLYRKIDSGVNPDVELSRLLTERTDFTNLARYAGSIEIRSRGREAYTAAMLQELVHNETDAWEYSLNSLQRYFKQVISIRGDVQEPPAMPVSVMEAQPRTMPVMMEEMIGVMYLDMARLLGRRTAQMHKALASLKGSPELEPEEFSTLYQKSIFQSMRALTLGVMENLRANLDGLSAGAAEKAELALESQGRIISRLRRIVSGKISACKIRIHGDYHLGQVLWTGKDLVIIDFEGEPARSLGQRRLKRSPLRDVAGMLRSLHYAARGALILHASVYGEHLQELSRWADLWYYWCGGTFLAAYLGEAAGSAMLPADRADFDILLEAFLMEKAVYELGYELNNRPGWIEIPLAGIEQLLEAPLAGVLQEGGK